MEQRQWCAGWYFMWLITTVTVYFAHTVHYRDLMQHLCCMSHGFTIYPANLSHWHLICFYPLISSRLFVLTTLWLQSKKKGSRGGNAPLLPDKWQAVALPLTLTGPRSVHFCCASTLNHTHTRPFFFFWLDSYHNDLNGKSGHLPSPYEASVTDRIGLGKTGGGSQWRYKTEL